MHHVEHSTFDRVLVVFEKRSDGGLRVSSPDVPGFRLSHSNPALVTADIIPALETIIGEMFGSVVRVRMAGEQLPLPEQPATPTQTDYTVRQIAA